METLEYLADNLEIIFKFFLFSLGTILLSMILCSWLFNVITILKFKREWWNHFKKYSTKRCSEEGEIKDGRDHIYLVDDAKKIVHRLTNSYTLNKLGYPRPPRVDDGLEKNKKFYFKFEDKYKLGGEIKILKGKATTYGAVAKYCKVPSARNVGWILKQNTEPDKIPCYKAVRFDGSLARGYKFGGASAQKRRLLFDGIKFDSNNKIQNFEQHSHILKNIGISERL